MMINRMKKKSGVYGWWLVVCLWSLTACSTITEELPLCEHYVAFRYDYNMKYADAFPVEVKKLTLYVFDEHDRLVTAFREERYRFGEGFRLPVRLPEGSYRLLVWAGLYDRSYDFTDSLVVGQTTPDELKVKVKRSEEGLRSTELDALWHGEARLTVDDAVTQTTTVSLVKDTNKFRVVVQAAGGRSLQAADLHFSIWDDNGYLAADNSLLKDTPITYRPYVQRAEDLGESGQRGMMAVVAEMNTCRLMENKHPRLRISNRNGEEIVNIDLIKYLLLTKMEGHDMGAQEYLDRQDEYALIFFLSQDAFGHYMVVQIKVNGWIIRPQSGDL